MLLIQLIWIIRGYFLISALDDFDLSVQFKKRHEESDACYKWALWEMYYGKCRIIVVCKCNDVILSRTC